MPQQITAHKVQEDGSVHESFDDALEHETRIRLDKLLLDFSLEEKNLDTLVERCVEIVDTLTPLAKERRAAMVQEERSHAITR